LVAVFNQPPAGETDFFFADYHRELWRCDTCGHFQNHHSFDLAQLYEGRYSQATYGEQLRANFKKIMALPPDRSDNRQRAIYIDEFWRSCATRARELVDIGSGLAVFPAAMREKGWRCLAIDPDPAAARQARELAGAEAMAGDFFVLEPPRRFALVTFNKVLEHVPDMVAMLDRAKDWLAHDGLIYVELPDGEAALTDPAGAAREEFFVEHYCAFSACSYGLLAREAGLAVHRFDRIREPSGKYTLRGFMGKV
jgi:2-polyprenyl-3-methyl-5-hydroxy-6-metoxy-1,4-benzoquinol methylase